jgi:hypothetical protein
MPALNLSGFVALAEGRRAQAGIRKKNLFAKYAFSGVLQFSRRLRQFEACHFFDNPLNYKYHEYICAKFAISTGRHLGACDLVHPLPAGQTGCLGAHSIWRYGWHQRHRIPGFLCLRRHSLLAQGDLPGQLSSRMRFGVAILASGYWAGRSLYLT